MLDITSDYNMMMYREGWFVHPFKYKVFGSADIVRRKKD